ncbi:MAG: hypothetical protein SF339_17005 [Blastocatellia bacterium]|nr:hypothetical protein [Blastocatellia bacterium]
MNDRSMRVTLWASVLLNGVGASLFAFPSSGFAGFLGLPTPASRLYSTLCALFVALFGAVYVWLARRPRIDRPLVGFAAITKAAVFMVFLIFWISGGVTTLGLAMVVPHLAVAGLFAWWLARTTTTRRVE